MTTMEAVKISNRFEILLLITYMGEFLSVHNCYFIGDNSYSVNTNDTYAMYISQNTC